MARDELRVDFKGPFFTIDPTKKLAENISDLMDALAEEAERDVQVQLKVGEPGRFPVGGGIKPGRVSAHVVGRTESLVGKEWRKSAVVSVRNKGFTKKQGIKLMAAMSWLESQTHAFRRTAGRIRRARAVITADLTKGMN